MSGGKQIFGHTELRMPERGEVVKFAAVMVNEITGEVTIRSRDRNGQSVEITLSPAAAAELGCSLSTAVFPFLPTNRDFK